MKKFLLFIVAVFATTTAFSQQILNKGIDAKVKQHNVAVEKKAPEAKTAIGKFQLSKPAMAEKLGNAQSLKTLKKAPAVGPKKAIASTTELEGTYHWNYKTAEKRAEDPSTVTGTAGTANVSIAVVDETTVAIKGMFEKDMNATVDLEKGTLTIARQAAGTSSYGDFDVTGMFYYAGDDTNQAGWYYTDIVATIGENGNITFDDTIWFNRVLTTGSYAGYSLNPVWMPGGTMESYELVYYNKPAGAMYYGFDKESNGYYRTSVDVAPWQDFIFENVSSKPKQTKWHINYTYPESYLAEYGLVSRYVDVTEDADEDGNYPMSMDPGYYSAAPTLINSEATDSFQISVDYNTDYSFTDATMIARFPHVEYNDSIFPGTFVDPHGSGYGFGALSTGYLYGTGKLNEGEDGESTCIAVEQAFPAPMSPLYVEDVFSIGLYSDSDTPLAEGKELTMTITGYDTETGKAIEDDVIAVLTASAADVTLLKGPNNITYTKTGVYYINSIVFTQKVQDELGVEGVEPFVIDRPFMVSITGWDQEGVNCGFRSVSINPEDVEMPDVAYFVMDDGSNQYYTEESLPITFSCLFDKVEVAESQTAGSDEIPYTNVLTVSDDGETCKVENEAGYDIPGVYVFTATPWYNEDGDDMYYLDELPEWVVSVNVDDSNYETEDSRDCLNIVSVTAEPLPEGVEGRQAVCHVVGRGFTSKAQIYINQGTVETAIKGVTVKDENSKFAGATYNLAGQKVGADYKGIVIENGKKVFKK